MLAPQPDSLVFIAGFEFFARLIFLHLRNRVKITSDGFLRFSLLATVRFVFFSLLLCCSHCPRTLVVCQFTFETFGFFLSVVKVIFFKLFASHIRRATVPTIKNVLIVMSGVTQDSVLQC